MNLNKIKYFNYSNENINNKLKKIDEKLNEISLVKFIENVSFEGFSHYESEEQLNILGDFDIIEFVEKHDQYSLQTLYLICNYVKKTIIPESLKGGIIIFFEEEFKKNLWRIADQIKLIFNNLEFIQKMIENYLSKIFSFLSNLKDEIQNCVFELNGNSASFSIENKYDHNLSNSLIFDFFTKLIRSGKILKFILEDELKNYSLKHFKKMNEQLMNNKLTLEEVFILKENFFLLKLKVSKGEDCFFCECDLKKIFVYLGDILKFPI